MVVAHHPPEGHAVPPWADHSLVKTEDRVFLRSFLKDIILTAVGEIPLLYQGGSLTLELSGRVPDRMGNLSAPELSWSGSAEIDLIQEMIVDAGDVAAAMLSRPDFPVPAIRQAYAIEITYPISPQLHERGLLASAQINRIEDITAHQVIAAHGRLAKWKTGAA